MIWPFQNCPPIKGLLGQFAAMERFLYEHECITNNPVQAKNDLAACIEKAKNSRSYSLKNILDDFIRQLAAGTILAQ